MSYSPSKPDSGPSPKMDASQIQTNFSLFASLFATNHTALNNKNQGDHEAVFFTIQTVDPVVVGSQAIVYCKNAPSKAGTQPQLFARIPIFLPAGFDTSKPGNPPMQLTYNTVNTSGPVYQSFLAGGYLLYFGKSTNIAIPITVSPAPTALLIAIAAPNFLVAGGSVCPVSTNIMSNTQFNIKSPAALPGGYSFSWIAIGTV